LAQLAVQVRDALPRVHTIRRVNSPSTSKLQSDNAEKSEAAEYGTEGPSTKTDPPTVTVDSLHRGNFATISEAIERVTPGTRILVRPGLYQEGLVIDKPLEIIGDGEPGEIVIQVSNYNVILFQTTMGRVANLTLRQLGKGKLYCVDIGQGRLELEDCDINSQGLACVGIHGGADPRLRRNRIHDSKSGDGVYFYENSQGTLEDNDIFGSKLAGVEIKQNGNPTLRRNRIHGNHAGVHVNDGGKGTLEDNDIFDNRLTGMQICNEANPIVRRNRIHDNKESGVFVNDAGHGMLEDNEIFGNGEAGVETTTAGKPIVKNNRMNKNTLYGVWIYKNGGGTFENNDLTGNTRGAWSIDEASEANITRTNNKE